MREVYCTSLLILHTEGHALGMRVFAWTFRSDPFYLNAAYGGDPQQARPLSVSLLTTPFPWSPSAFGSCFLSFDRVVKDRTEKID